MEVKKNDVVTFHFATHRFDTGVATNADSLPSATAYEDNGAADIGGCTVTNISTGLYRVDVDTSDADYESGKFYNIDVSATVNSVTGKACVGTFKCVAAEVDDVSTALAATDGKVDTIDGIVDAILVDTAEIGVAGAGLTAISSNVSSVTPDVRSVDTGAETGTFPDDLGTADWNYWITSDGAGAYDVTYQWGVMPASGSIPVGYIPIGIKVRMTVGGDATEDPTFALWNYTTSAFDDIKTVVATSVGGYYSDFYIPLKEPYVILDSSSNATADAVALNIYGTAEVAARKVYLDYVLLDCYDPTRGSALPFPFLSQNTDITAPADHSNVAKEATLGTPAGADLATDIAAVKADTAAILVDTGTTIPATLGTPADTDLATDIANVQTDTTAILADTAEVAEFKDVLMTSTWTKQAIDATSYYIIVTGIGYWTVDETAGTRTWTDDVDGP